MSLQTNGFFVLTMGAVQKSSSFLGGLGVSAALTEGSAVTSGKTTELLEVVTAIVVTAEAGWRKPSAVLTIADRQQD